MNSWKSNKKPENFCIKIYQHLGFVSGSTRAELGPVVRQKKEERNANNHGNMRGIKETYGDPREIWPLHWKYGSYLLHMFCMQQEQLFFIFRVGLVSCEY